MIMIMIIIISITFIIIIGTIINIILYFYSLSPKYSLIYLLILKNARDSHKHHKIQITPSLNFTLGPPLPQPLAVTTRHQRASLSQILQNFRSPLRQSGEKKHTQL